MVSLFTKGKYPIIDFDKTLLSQVLLYAINAERDNFAFRVRGCIRDNSRVTNPRKKLIGKEYIEVADKPS